MRNDTDRWDAPAPLSFEAEGLCVTHTAVPHQTMVSGTDVQARYASAVGWPESARGPDYVVSMRRDRVLLVNGASLPAGFDPATGLAVSDMTDAYEVIDLTGPQALSCLKAGAELDLQLPSRSAVRRVFGTEVILYRYGDEMCFRVHVPRAFGPAFVASLTAAAR